MSQYPIITVMLRWALTFAATLAFWPAAAASGRGTWPRSRRSRHPPYHSGSSTAGKEIVKL